MLSLLSERTNEPAVLLGIYVLLKLVILLGKVVVIHKLFPKKVASFSPEGKLLMAAAISPGLYTAVPPFFPRMAEAILLKLVSSTNTLAINNSPHLHF
jgi:hypothetical protein